MKKEIGLLVIAFFAMCVISCSNSRELRFLGKSLCTPCEEFKKHLENNGFKPDGGDTYRGNYLGEEVGIVLEKEENGHYTQMTIMLVSDVDVCKKFYKKLCREIGKEHDGFIDKEKEKDDNLSYIQQSSGENINIPINEQKKTYYNEEGKEITITYYNASLIATVMARFDSDE